MIMREFPIPNGNEIPRTGSLFQGVFSGYLALVPVYSLKHTINTGFTTNCRNVIYYPNEHDSELTGGFRVNEYI